jgi:hypothetical protein
MEMCVEMCVLLRASLSAPRRPQAKRCSAPRSTPSIWAMSGETVWAARPNIVPAMLSAPRPLLTNTPCGHRPPA